jgi:hypothetical protein
VQEEVLALAEEALDVRPHLFHAPRHQHVHDAQADHAQALQRRQGRGALGWPPLAQRARHGLHLRVGDVAEQLFVLVAERGPVDVAGAV